MSQIVSNESAPGVLAAEGTPALAPPAGRRTRRRPALLLISALSVALVLALWYFATERGWVSPVFLPKPGRVVAEAIANFASGQLLKDIWMSTQRVLLGFLLAGVVAVPLGIIMAVWAPAKAAMDPFVSLLRPLPPHNVAAAEPTRPAGAAPDCP